MRSLSRQQQRNQILATSRSVTQGAPHIEMNLACGVLDLKDNNAAAAAQRAVNVASSSEAMEHLPILKEDEGDAVTEPGFLDISRAAAAADGDLMTERASRRLGAADKTHADSSCNGVERLEHCAIHKRLEIKALRLPIHILC